MAEHLMFASGVTAVAITVYCVRQRDMREKYALLWLIVAACVGIVGIVPDLIKSFAHTTNLAYPTAVLFWSLTIIYLFSLSVSISLTRHHRRTIILLQEMALLQAKVRKLEDQLDTRNVRDA